MKNSTHWLLSFIRRSPFQLLLITAFTTSCTKNFYPEVSTPPPTNENFEINYELLNDIRSDPKYQEVLEVSSESYKKSYVDSLLASSMINDSTNMQANSDYILHKYIIIDRYIKSYPEFNYKIVGRHVRYDLMMKKKEKRKNREDKTSTY